MNLLNIGCGETFHIDWINLDAVSKSPYVQTCDLRKGIPYPNNSIDVCYSSHVLEHLTQDAAANFIRECYRVLKSNGIIRVVVPDLEAIAKEYLHALDNAKSGTLEAIQNYDWILLELYDQVVRSRPGGDMAPFLRRSDLVNQKFILSRFGYEAKEFWHRDLKSSKQFEETSTWSRIKAKLSPHPIQKLRLKIARILVALIAGKRACQIFEEGLFRDSGEIHRWMYDRVSLERLLAQSGFVDIAVCKADQSRIPDFHTYSLDVVNGEVRKPDSLFMEAIKP